jgi:hypothetical protein
MIFKQVGQYVTEENLVSKIEMIKLTEKQYKAVID